MSQYIFLSYVSEDEASARRLAEGLRSFGISVWRDREALQAGDRWKQAIRQAIAQGAAFLCCYSVYSERRARSYMREEVLLAFEELRMRTMSRTWFIPVLLDGTSPIDDFRIAPGFNLSDIHYVDMSKDWDAGLTSIITALVSEHQPAERARLARQLDIAVAMERLATSEGLLATDPFSALALSDNADRVPETRAIRYHDLIEESFAGIYSFSEIQTGAGYYGATHLASNQVALSVDPSWIVWSARGGHVAVHRPDHGKPLLLGSLEGGIPDVFIDDSATRVAAVSFHDRRVRSWEHVTANNWIPADNQRIDWSDMLGTIGNRYATYGQRLYTVHVDDKGVAFQDFVSGEILVLQIGRPKYLAVDPTGIHLRALIEDRLVAYQRSSQGHWSALGGWDWAQICDLTYPREHSLRPFGIVVRRDGRTLLRFNGQNIILSEPGMEISQSTCRKFDGWDGTLMPAGVAGFAYGANKGMGFSQGIELMQHGQRSNTVARCVANLSALRSSTADRSGRRGAVVDDNGRAVVFDTQRTGSAFSTSQAFGKISMAHSLVGYGDTLVGERTDGRLGLISGLGNSSGEPLYTTLTPPLPESRHLLDIKISARTVVATYRLAQSLVRVGWQVDLSDPHVLFVSAVADPVSGKPLSENTEFDESSRFVLWQTSPGEVSLFETSPELKLVGVYRFDEPPSRDVTFSYSVGHGLVAILALGKPLHVYEVGSAKPIAKVMGTGLGSGGGAWGDSPANLKFCGATLIAAKRSGSLARWRLPLLEPVGLPKDLNNPNQVRRLDVIGTPEHGAMTGLVSTYGYGAWLIRDLANDEIVPRFLTGFGEYIGPASSMRIWARRTDDELVCLDLSTGSIAQSVGAFLSRVSTVHVRTESR